MKMKKKINPKEGFIYGLIGVATLFTIGILVFILGFIFSKGLPHVNLYFLTSQYDSTSAYVDVKLSEGSQNPLGLILEETTIKEKGSNEKKVIAIKEIEKTSLGEDAINNQGQPLALSEKDIINRVNGINVEGKSVEEVNQILNSINNDTVTMRITKQGGGIFPMIITTLMMIGLSLLFSVPIGVFAAIYLVEYAKPGKFVNLVRFATESLAGIPSIIYGLFGMILFVMTLNLGYSLLAGALTLSIILLPVIIRQTEESLKAVPDSYREASYGLGANKIYTITKVVLPTAVPGIVVAIILSIGRIIGESAALLLTAGTAAKIPGSLLESGSTLTVKAYTVAKEEANIELASAIGSVIIIIIIILNALSKLISKKFSKI